VVQSRVEAQLRYPFSLFCPGHNRVQSEVSPPPLAYCKNLAEQTSISFEGPSRNVSGRLQYIEVVGLASYFNLIYVLFADR
jgi:hypothetical protein